MSILATDLIAYSVTNIPTDDNGTSGGAIDATRRPVFTQLASTGALTYVSDGADVRTVTVIGRDATGGTQTEVVTLNGTSQVVGTIAFQRILSLNVSTIDGARTVTITQGGSSVGTVPPTELGFHMLFQNSSSSSSQQVRYEKLFWKNNNSSLTLTSSSIELVSDPASKVNVGVAASVNDTGSVTNRLSAPAGITFVGIGISQNVPGGGNLTAGSAIGVWLKQTLLANDAPVLSTATTQLSGTSV